MDLSKLPKMGSTPPPAPPAEPVRTGPETSHEPAPVDAMALGWVWITIILGLLFIFFGMNFAKWSVANLAGKPFPTGVEWAAGEKRGQQVEYWELQGHTALAEMGQFILGVSLILEAIILAWVLRRWRGWRIALHLAIGIALLATAINAYATIRVMIFGLPPIVSLVALALSGLGVFYLVSLRATGRSDRGIF